MAYYRGDYYRGDYYRGDPFALPVLGALGAKLASKVLPGIAKKVVGVLAKPKVAATIGTVATVAGAAQAIPYKPVPMRTAAPGIPVGPVTLRPQNILPGGQPALVASQKPSGHHWSDKAGRWVKNRRMNVTNSRALRRAIRRATGFAKLARRVLTFTSPRAPKGKAIFRRRRK